MNGQQFIITLTIIGVLVFVISFFSFQQPTGNFLLNSQGSLEQYSTQVLTASSDRYVNPNEPRTIIREDKDQEFNVFVGDINDLLPLTNDNIYSVAWNKLTGFPAGCPSGYAVTNINTMLTCQQFLTSYTETDPVYIAEKSTIVFENDNISRLVNDANYITIDDIPEVDLNDYVPFVDADKNVNLNYNKLLFEKDLVDYSTIIISGAGSTEVNGEYILTYDDLDPLNGYGYRYYEMGDYVIEVYYTWLDSNWVLDSAFISDIIDYYYWYSTYDLITWEIDYGDANAPTSSFVSMLGENFVDYDKIVDIEKGVTAFSWGNHSLLGYLTSYTETDPVYSSGITNYYNKTQSDERYLNVMLGEGTAINPYKISSWSHLQNISNDLSAHYVLTRDLLSADSDYSGIGSDWSPLGTFSGTLNGNGFTINDLTINSTANDVGLFSTLAGASCVVKNLTITGNIVSTGNNVGSVAGWIISATIENVVNNANVTGYSSVGGIVGRGFILGVTNYIKNCYNTGTITGFSNTGGIQGDNSAGSNINNCFSTGDIRRSSGVNTTFGGVVGASNGVARITNIGWLTTSGTQPSHAIGHPATAGTYDTNNITDFYSSSYGIFSTWNFPFSWLGSNLPLLQKINVNNWVVDGNLFINGSVMAKDYITLSRVADLKDNKKALDNLKNIDEWLVVDIETGLNKINYSKHYAHEIIENNIFVGYELEKREVETCELLFNELEKREVETCETNLIDFNKPIYEKSYIDGLNESVRIKELEKMVYELSVELCLKDKSYSWCESGVKE
jgi:hypothetical protein